MQRSPNVTTELYAPADGGMCPMGFMPIPSFLIPVDAAVFTMWQSAITHAWQMAAGQPRRVHVTQDDLPINWRN